MSNVARRVKAAEILRRAGWGKAKRGLSLLRFIDYPMPTGYSLNKLRADAYLATVSGESRTGQRSTYGMEGVPGVEVTEAVCRNRETSGVLSSGTMPHAANFPAGRAMPGDRIIVDQAGDGRGFGGGPVEYPTYEYNDLDGETRTIVQGIYTQSMVNAGYVMIRFSVCEDSEIISVDAPVAPDDALPGDVPGAVPVLLYYAANGLALQGYFLEPQ